VVKAINKVNEYQTDTSEHKWVSSN